MRSSTRREFLLTSATAAAAFALAPRRLFAAESARPRWPIAGFTKPFDHLSYDALADLAAEVGWDGIECPVRATGYIEPVRAADDLPRLADTLKHRGKSIALLATDITSATQEHAEPLLRTAAALGIRRYRLGDQRYDLRRPIPGQVAEIAARLRELAALNRELGLQGVWQNHSGMRYAGGPVWDIWTATRDLDPRHLAACFDLGHATVEGGTVWPVNARLLRDRIGAVIVKDFVWHRTDKGWRPGWTPLGEGMIDPEFFRWLKTTSFDGPIVQHFEYELGQGKDAVAHLRRDLATLRRWLCE